MNSGSLASVALACRCHLIFSDIRELKTLLEIDPSDTSSDKKLSFFNEHAANIIEELLDRDFTYKSRVRYYDGTGTQKLLLRHRPVYPSPPAPFSSLAVIVDEAGLYGTAPNSYGNNAANKPLVYGTDYTLKIDMDDGGSRSAILYRINEFWPKPFSRVRGMLTPFVGVDMGSVQVTYTAGYTVDTLPAGFREAAGLLIARMNSLWPLGLPLNSESYGDSAGSVGMGYFNQFHDLLTGLVKPLLYMHRNWSF